MSTQAALLAAQSVMLLATTVGVAVAARCLGQAAKDLREIRREGHKKTDGICVDDDRCGCLFIPTGEDC
ncbi:hypothetical protein AA18890_3202 [Komagataeibacter europaeus LMG 18890]|nr:hypothetical protein AA18890_3202 [Komagataeibacter europaeus LMG 18890]